MRQYEFTPEDLKVETTARQMREPLIGICKVLFETFANVGVTTVSTQALRDSVARVADGQRPVAVFHCQFSPKTPTAKPVAQFIIRLHTGIDAESEGRKEREVVQVLTAAAADILSCNLVTDSRLPEGAVVYRHAADTMGEDLVFSITW